MPAAGLRMPPAVPETRCQAPEVRARALPRACSRRGVRGRRLSKGGVLLDPRLALHEEEPLL
eukprot:5235780-Alexandrium_andersonii.AAC.1